MTTGGATQVNTRVPYRIDVHHHVLPRFYVEALTSLGNTTTFGMTLPGWSLEAHLKVMDRNKIAVGMASMPAPGLCFPSDTSARDLARQCNEYLAWLRSEIPGRFGAFAALPLPYMDAALEEATYGLDALEADGVLMLSNVGGRYPGDPEYGELFAELDRRNTVVYIHPGEPPDRGIPDSIKYAIDTALETVRAVMSLLYGGVLERYPNVRFIFSHCGGITPYLAHRMVRGGTWVRGDGGADPGLLDDALDGEATERALVLLQRQYYDSMSANAANGWRTLQAFVDPSHILLGTDHAALPAALQPIKTRELRGYKGFDDALLMGVERENALRLFPRLLEVL